MAHHVKQHLTWAWPCPSLFCMKVNPPSAINKASIIYSLNACRDLSRVLKTRLKPIKQVKHKDTSSYKNSKWKWGGGACWRKFASKPPSPKVLYSRNPSLQVPIAGALVGGAPRHQGFARAQGLPTRKRGVTGGGPAAAVHTSRPVLLAPSRPGAAGLPRKWGLLAAETGSMSGTPGQNRQRQGRPPPTPGAAAAVAPGRCAQGCGCGGH
jgi:hypothetical protein